MSSPIYDPLANLDFVTGKLYSPRGNGLTNHSSQNVGPEFGTLPDIWDSPKPDSPEQAPEASPAPSDTTAPTPNASPAPHPSDSEMKDSSDRSSSAHEEEDEDMPAVLRIAIDVLVYLSEKIKGKKGAPKSWSPIVVKGVVIEWNQGDAYVDELLESAAYACDASYKKVSVLILEVYRNKKKETKLTGYIKNSKQFPKTVKDRQEINDTNIAQFLDLAAEHPDREIGVSFHMTNPASAIAKSAKAAKVAQASRQLERKRHLSKASTPRPSSSRLSPPFASSSRLTYQRSAPSHRASTSRLSPPAAKTSRGSTQRTGTSQIDVRARATAGSSSDDPPTDVSSSAESEVTTQDQLLLRLYEKNKPNLKYDRLLPVHINPTDSTKYIPLSEQTALFWVSKLHRDGVTFNSPPSELKYRHKDLTEDAVPDSTAPKAPGSTNDLGSIANIVAGVITGLGYPGSHPNPLPAPAHTNTRASTPLPAAAPAPSLQIQASTSAAPAGPGSSPVGMDAGREIDDYLEFLKFPIHQVHDIGNMLRLHDLADYRLLNAEDAPREELEKLDLSMGVISRLYKGVEKFKAALAKAGRTT